MVLTKEAGKTYSQAELKAALEQHKPKLLFLTQACPFAAQDGPALQLFVLLLTALA